MARIFYVHWHKEEALRTVRQLRAGGHTVGYHWSTGAEAWRLLKDSPPDAVVISLDRLPSHGRAVAEATTESKRLRELPLVFVGGETEKVAATRNKFPRARYCAADELLGVLNDLPPFEPLDPATLQKRSNTASTGSRPPSGASGRTAGYSGTPLPQKLGIKPDHEVAIVNAPVDFLKTLGELPLGAVVRAKLWDGILNNVIVVFARSRAELERGFVRALRRLHPAGGLWIAWPKKASGVETDLSESDVRELGLAAGLVDNKVCAVDETWSGLRFVVRVKDRPAAVSRTKTS